jgi:hypothetical protein
MYRDFMRVTFQVSEGPRACPTDPDPIGVPITMSLNTLLSDRVLCDENEEDLYQVTLTQPTRLEVYTTFTHSVGDLDLILLNQGQEISRSSSTSDEEVIQTDLLQPGTYTVRVYLFAQGPSIYTVGINELNEQQVCQADQFETTQDNNSQQNATPLNQVGDYNLNLCLNDRDYFRFDLEQGEILTLQTEFNNQIADLDMRLTFPIISPAIPPESRLSNSTENFERIEIEAPTSGVYFLSVYLVGSGTLDYQLSVDKAAPVECDLDRLDMGLNNDQRTSASLLFPELYQDLIGCDLDWYSTQMNESQTFILYITFDGPRILPTVAVQGDNQASLNPQLEFIPKTGGCLPNREHCVRMEIDPLTYQQLSYSIAFTQRNTPYDLRVRLGDELGSVCDDQSGCGSDFTCIGFFDIYSFDQNTCSRECTQNTDCGSQGACIFDDFGPSRCLQRCDLGLNCLSPSLVCESGLNSLGEPNVSVCVGSVYDTP